jgi:hypothetical protein
MVCTGVEPSNAWCEEADLEGEKAADALLREAWRRGSKSTTAAAAVVVAAVEGGTEAGWRADAEGRGRSTGRRREDASSGQEREAGDERRGRREEGCSTDLC